jgi:aminopeptidase N
MCNRYFCKHTALFGLDEKSQYKTFELPGSKPHYTPDKVVHVQHIALDLDFDIENQSYTGTCSLRLNPILDGITQLTLDAVELEVESVRIGRIEQKYETLDKHLQIFLEKPTIAGREFTLEISYSAVRPKRGIYFIGPTQAEPERGWQVWTQGEDEDSRFWFPCFDYPGQLSTTEMKVRVPKKYTVVGNGDLHSSKEKSGFKTFHWVLEEPHPSYLVALAIGEFSEIETTWDNKPVTYYAVKGKEEDLKRTLASTPKMLEFFSRKFGVPYAFAKYAQVCASEYIFGGMENTSLSILTDRCLLDKRASLDTNWSESLVAHELAHQWFGDLVVIKHWSHAWIKEGAATYGELLWTEHSKGKDEADYYRLLDARSYISEDKEKYRRPMVTNIYKEPIELYDSHIYEKGGQMYHMLRSELGDELFFKSIKTFLENNRHKTVETVDLMRAIEQACGRNMGYLFDQYVFRGGYPEFKLDYSFDEKHSLAKLTVIQKQSEKYLFDLTVQVGFGYTKKDKFKEFKLFPVHISQKEQTFYIPLHF